MSAQPFLQLPAGFLEWMPLAQAAALGLLTFVQEDVPTVAAATLAAAGRISWVTGWTGCFLGIWIGDALLYLLARSFGRQVLAWPWVARWVSAGTVERTEEWFARRGSWLLVSSRFIPGTRLPTYLAAGFLRLPWRLFLGITGAAALVWTVALFLLARGVGSGLSGVVERPGWAAAGVAAALFAVTRTASRSGRILGVLRNLRQAVEVRRERWSRWEFWPAWLFYAPVAVQYLRLSLRHRSLTLPTASNPGIEAGGFVGESKLAILRALSASSPGFVAEAHAIDGDTPSARFAAFEALLRARGIPYPCILKPDVGQRGAGVKKITHAGQARAYFARTAAPLLLQRYVPGPFEAGVFYYRFPAEPRGRIFAITEKVFPAVTGDGVRTLEALIRDDPRARLIADTYLTRLGPRALSVPAEGECVRLVEAGNHAQGCIFRDGAHLRTEALERRIDEISRGCAGFHIGRYDIRCPSEEAFRRGEGLQVIELNGASSEATSIYDARHSLAHAYRTLFRQWELVFEIGAANRRAGAAPMGIGALIALWREGRRRARTYPVAD